MSKILSFEAADELVERIQLQLDKQPLPYLSPFLRKLIEDALTVLEEKDK